MNLFNIISIFLFLLLFSGCYISSPKTVMSPATSEQLELTGDLLQSASGNWLYGPGLGQTMMNMGAVAIYPPYVAVVVSNLALDLAGYDTIGLGLLLQDDSEEKWDTAYDTFISGPGRVSSLMAGTPYRTRAEVEARSKELLQHAMARMKPAGEAR